MQGDTRRILVSGWVVMVESPEKEVDRHPSIQLWRSKQETVFYGVGPVSCIQFVELAWVPIPRSSATKEEISTKPHNSTLKNWKTLRGH